MANPIDVPQNFSTTLNVGGGIDNSQTSGIVLTSVSGLPTDGGILCIDWATTLDTSVAEFIEYTGISSNTLTGVIRGVEGVSAKAHANGAVIAGVISRQHIKRLRDKLTGNDGTLVQDPNGNEIIKTSYNASAVNEITATNAATGNAPQVAATGNDTNIDFNIVTKGTGVVKFNGVAAPTTTGATDGWLADSNTWVYVSASSFKVSGVDVTATYQPGTLLRFKQGGSYKYANVASSSFSTDTTVNIIVNTDYVLANAAITNNYYSYQVNPQGFPSAFTYAPTWGGFSANPTGAMRYSVTGRRITIDMQASSNGTSNATTLTFSLPVATTQTLVCIVCRVVDNGSALTTVGRIDIATSTATVYKDMAQATFTASGGKDVIVQFSYEF